jgi:hypothetical protein
MVLERISIGMPIPRKMADIKKNRIIVFESEGIGSQAFSICCLNLSIKGYSTSELLPLL